MRLHRVALHSCTWLSRWISPYAIRFVPVLRSSYNGRTDLPHQYCGASHLPCLPCAPAVIGVNKRAAEIYRLERLAGTMRIRQGRAFFCIGRLVCPWWRLPVLLSAGCHSRALLLCGLYASRSVPGPFRCGPTAMTSPWRSAVCGGCLVALLGWRMW